MDIRIFVKNVKFLLDERKISYSKAGRESGAGEDFIRNIDRKGSYPSIDKVQKMAEYLGVTVSELLGEEPPDKEKPTPDFLVKFESLTPDDQDEVLAIIELKLSKKRSR